MPAPTESDILSQLRSSSPSCRLWPEQTEGPYRRDVHPERRVVTEGLCGLPLRLGLRLLGATGVPLDAVPAEMWQADQLGRYSGFRPFTPTPGEVETSEAVPRDAVAGRETLLRGGQRTDPDGLCAFRTINPGWYASRTVQIHTIAHLPAHHVTTQLYFDDAISDAEFGHPTYRDRPPRDTTNTIDTIFVDGGAQTLLDLRGDPVTGLIGTLCVAVYDARRP